MAFNIHSICYVCISGVEQTAEANFLSVAIIITVRVCVSLCTILINVHIKNAQDIFSIVTIASEPASIDYDRSFEEKNRDVDSMSHGHVD